MVVSVVPYILPLVYCERIDSNIEIRECLLCKVPCLPSNYRSILLSQSLYNLRSYGTKYGFGVRTITSGACISRRYAQSVDRRVIIPRFVDEEYDLKKEERRGPWSQEAVAVLVSPDGKVSRIYPDYPDPDEGFRIVGVFDTYDTMNYELVEMKTTNDWGMIRAPYPGDIEQAMYYHFVSKAWLRIDKLVLTYQATNRPPNERGERWSDYDWEMPREDTIRFILDKKQDKTFLKFLISRGLSLERAIREKRIPDNDYDLCLNKYGKKRAWGRCYKCPIRKCPYRI